LRILDRYLLREIAVPFCVSMALFFVVVAFAQVLKVSNAITGLGVTGIDIFQALLYSLPPLMGLLIPVSMLFATLLGVGRIASDHEIVAMSAAGISRYRHLRVPVVFGSLLATLCALILVYGEPWGIRGVRRVIKRSAQRALASGVRIGEFNEWVPGVTFMAQDEKDGALRNVVFADRRNAERPVVISAKRGRVVTGSRVRDMVFDLRDGNIVLHDQDADLVRVLEFEKCRYLLDVNRVIRGSPRTTSSYQGMTLTELWEASRDANRSLKKRVTATIILHRKVTLPLATLIFGMLAVPLAMRASSGARARSFLYSAGIVGVYYYLGRAFEGAAREGNFPAHLVAWVPNLLGFAALVVLLWRMKRVRS
jgi:LPS export ABC transporter permease LptF